MIPHFTPWITRANHLAVDIALAAGRLGPGPVCRELERRLAHIHNRQHCALTCSGSHALMWAIVLNNPYPGQAVGLPAYCVLSVVNAVYTLTMQTQAPAVFVDVDPAHGCLVKPDDTPKPGNGAVLVHVDNNGATGHLGAVVDLCARDNLALVEDACASLGRPGVAPAAHDVVLSFAAQKIVTGGQGGALLTNSAERARQFRNQCDQGGGGWRESGIGHAHGGNHRFTDIQASLVLSQLDEIDLRLERGRAVRDTFTVRLASLEGVTYMDAGDPPFHNVIRVHDHERAPVVAEKLWERGIEARWGVYRHAVRHRREVFERYDVANDIDATLAQTPGAAQLEAESVFLPFGPGLTPDDAERVVRAVIEVVED